MVIITNKGLIDPLAFELIGASSKRSDSSTIGFFGSGVKYAIAGLLGRGIPFQVWRGNEMIDFATEEVEMRDMKFQRITINGRPTSMTTTMGPKWETWMLLRELYANAIDEGGEMAVTDQYEDFITEGRTTIILPDADALKDILDRQDYFFTRGRDVVYEDERLKVYEDIGTAGYYVKGIFVGGSGTGHGYQIKDEPYEINEERVVMYGWKAQSATFERIMHINCAKTVRRIVAKAKQNGSIERGLFTNTCPFSFGSVKPSEAWSNIMFFPQESATFAVEWNHVVVSDEIYNKLNHPNKWTQRKWSPVGTNEQNKRLSDAYALVRREHPAACDSHTIMFGRSASKALGMGTEDGVIYVSEGIADEPVEALAAHLTMMLSEKTPEIGLKCLTKYYTA